MNNVVKLAEPTVEPKAKRSGASTDARIIRECVAYAQAMGAAAAGFRADPDCDNKFAGPTSVRLYDSAHASLEKLTKLKAVTPEALQAKARIVPAIFEQCAGALEDCEFAFIEAFAADVQAYLRPTIEERWRLNLAAKRAAAQSREAIALN